MGFWLRRSGAAIFLTLSLAACAASTGQQGGAGSSGGSSAGGAAATSDEEGASIERAVVLSDAHNEMEGISAEHKWTAAHYPGWGWDAQSLLNQGAGSTT